MTPSGDHIKRVSVVIPCRNEEAFITKVMDSILAQDYPAAFLEVLVVDGESEDRTAEIIQEYSSRHPHIHYLNNPDKVVPHARNKAIRQSTGSIVLRMDAHSEYPEHYISSLVSGLDQFNCDNTGGVWITEPANDSAKARAIADAISHPFGIGNALYRLNVKSPKKVDTVPYGCYRREVFDRIGLFDEELVRNQDDEFNARLIRHGGSIYLLPAVKIRYFARDRLLKTSRMFYQYGLYKPLVNLKVGKPATLRQFAPPLFTLFILLGPVLSLISSDILWAFSAGITIYLLSDFLVSLSIVNGKKRPMSVLFFIFWLFPLIHLSYGYGYLAGIIRFVLLGKSVQHSAVDINR